MTVMHAVGRTDRQRAHDSLSCGIRRVAKIAIPTNQEARLFAPNCDGLGEAELAKTALEALSKWELQEQLKPKIG